MSENSFHIYDRRRDYSLTNIRDILFDVNKKTDSYDYESDKGRNSYINLFGKGGFGIRHFVTINLFLTLSVDNINKLSVFAAIPYMLNNTARWSHNTSYTDRRASFFPNLGFSTSDIDDDDLVALDGGINRHNITKGKYDCPLPLARRRIDISMIQPIDGPYDWTRSQQDAAAASFLYTYVPAAVPASLIARRFGAKPVMSTGLLIQSLFAMMIPAAAESGFLYLQIVRMIQGAALAPVHACAYMLLANWIPPSERSRMVAVVLSGSYMGELLLNYLCKTLCVCQLCGGCAAHFYFFAACSIMLSMFFTFFMWEDPEICPLISEKEKRYIMNELGRSHLNHDVPSQVPWKSFATSAPCWALLAAEVAEHYVLFTAYGHLPNYMKSILHASVADTVTSQMITTMPLFLTCSSSWILAVAADYLILHDKMATITVRKLFNSIGLYGAAIGFSVACHLGCNPNNTIAIYAITVVFNGAHLSGLKANYLDISSNFVGILVAITSTLGFCSKLAAQFSVLLMTQGKITLQKWQLVFFVAALVPAVAATVFNFLASSERQPWDRENTPHSTLSNTKSVTFIKDEPKGDTASRESLNK